MSTGAAPAIERARAWPMTRAAWDELVAEIERLRSELRSLAGQGIEEGVLQLPIAITVRRLDALKDMLERCDIVDDRPCVAIGRRAIVSESDGEVVSYELALPGTANLDRGCISADSPLAMALLGAHSGDVVQVDAPAGRWSLTVLSVDDVPAREGASAR
jgi:transcription elongation GreA/GreB family factor